MVKAAKMIEN